VARRVDTVTVKCLRCGHVGALTGEALAKFSIAPSTPIAAFVKNTGVICLEEMVATFCNVPTGPNLNGYGSSGSVGSRAASGSSAGSGVNGPAGGAGPSAAIPTCSEFPPANELCN
jgi:hypothetical protein